VVLHQNTLGPLGVNKIILIHNVIPNFHLKDSNIILKTYT
jgi:hypothetical protein